MGRDDDFRCRWLKHPLRNFQRGSTWRSNYDPLTAPNRVVDDLQFLPRISVESIVNRNSGTIGILKGCCYFPIFIASMCACAPERNQESKAGIGLPLFSPAASIRFIPCSKVFLPIRLPSFVQRICYSCAGSSNDWMSQALPMPRWPSSKKLRKHLECGSSAARQICVCCLA